MPTNLLTGEPIAEKKQGVNLLPELTGINKDSEGDVLLPETSRREPLIQDLYNSFQSGLARTWATTSRIPAGIYTMAAMPQNFLMKSIGKSELQVRSPEWLMDNPVAELYDFQTEAYRKAITPTKSFEEAFETKDFDGIGRHLAIQVVENAPQQIGIILSFMAGYPNVGIAGMGALEITSSLKEARKKKKDPAMSAYNSLAKGVIEMGFESIGTMGILNKWSKSLAKSFGTKNAWKIMGDIFKTIFYSMLGEGNEEFWTSLAQDFSDYSSGINPDAMKGSLARATEGGAVGAISGGLLTGPGAIRIGHASASLNKIKEEANRVRETLEEDAKPPEIPPEKPVEARLEKPIAEPGIPGKAQPGEIPQGKQGIVEEEAKKQEISEELIKTTPITKKSIKSVLSERLQKEIQESKDKEGKRISLLDQAKLELKNIEATIKAIKEIPEFTEMGENIFEDKQGLLKGLMADKKIQQEKISELQPEKVTRTTVALLKERVKATEQGIRAGTIKTKADIKVVQSDVIELFKAAKLDIPVSIKSIQTPEQFKKALPEIKERIARLVERAEKDAIVQKINRLAKVKVDADYRDQIDEILEQFDLKRRTAVTKERRQKKAEFIERQREEGNLDFLPPGFFTDFGKKTLDEMSLEEVEQLRDQIQVLATVGATKARLLAMKGERDFQARLTNIVDKIYARIGKTEQVEGEVTPLVSRPERGLIDEIKNQIDAYFAMHRKIEFVTLALQVNEDIFETIQEGINKELTTGGEVYDKLKSTFSLISKDLNTMTKKEVKIEGIDVPLTRQQMIGVALNNGNAGNRQRLIDGNKFTIEQIRAIENELKPNEKQFVEQIFEIIDSLFPETVRVTKKMYGVKPKKVEGKYFPIIPDKELNKQAKLREAERDLFQEIFHVTFIERYFTKSREGGRAPVDLNVFNVIFKHIDQVIHYNSLTIPVRDIQKIIKHPRFEKSIAGAMGDNVYNQFSSWLRDIANPKGLQASNTMDKISQYLRHNATAAILGHRLTVSLLQGGSFTQTINDIGLPDSINGIAQFYKNPKQAIEFVYSKSPIMKNRKQRFDREIRDWLKTNAAVKITQGKKSYSEMLFILIRGVDFVTTMPTWIGAYEKNLRETQNPEDAVRYADGVTRRTQPAGAMENLSSVMRGTQTQKLFTSFMTHFSNMHNQMVLAMDELKYSQDHPLRNSANFARSMWWVWVAPSLLAGWIRSGFKIDDWRRFAMELVLYPFAGMFLIRDLMSSLIKGFDFGAPPGLGGLKETSYAFKGKAGRTKLKHGVKAVGLLTGKIPTQWVDSVEGFIDLVNEETQDFRRLIWGESALKPVTKGIFKAPKLKSSRPKIGGN